MRAWLLLTATLAVIPPAYADLFTAQLAYQKGDYERAYKDYRELAEIGQPLAQYNLAIMYAKGQGVRQSDLNAYAWATLAAAGGEARGQELADHLRAELAPGSEKIAGDLVAPYSRAALDERLMPKVLPEDAALKTCHIVAWDRDYLRYPPQARAQGIQGNLYVEFVVMPDGTARSPRILYSLVGHVFDSTVRNLILHFRYAERDASDPPIHCAMLVRFRERGLEISDYPKLMTVLSTTREKALAGDVPAELLYGMLLAGVPQLGHSRKDALPWFLKAAQSGSRDAQFEIGSSLLLGLGCQCEETKAEVWLRKAAEADQSNAQVTLAQYALRGTPDATQTQIAKAWLERAAASGDHDGMFYLAALLAATPLKEYRDPSRALRLLDNMKKELGEDPSEFEIRAAAHAEAGAFDQAVESERRAIEMARKLHWELAPLNDRLARYQAREAWYGNLLTL